MLKLNCNVRIADELMGRGKTSAAINMINQSDDDEKFMFITPYLKEVERIKVECPSKRFREPYPLHGKKLESIKDLINRGENIVSTHALFQKFDLEVIDMCRARNYTLILDEVTEVIEKYDISNQDFQILSEKFVDIDENTGLLKWRGNDDYYGKFTEEKRLCELNSLAYYGGSVMMWLFPIEVFDAFRKIYILTYMFHAQIQRYYYDYYQLPYKYIYVKGNSKKSFTFTEDITERNRDDVDYKTLVHILNDTKLNLIGDREYDLSKTWYDRNKDNSTMKQLKNNLVNFFINKRKTKTALNIWTTFKDFKGILNGKGYSKGFVPLNMRASNDYCERNSIAYPVNRFLDPGIKHFFMKHNVEVDEDGYALSEMLQFIWRSAIRNGQEVWVYIPSIRMRRLLEQWIEQNSLPENALQNNPTPNEE